MSKGKSFKKSIPLVIVRALETHLLEDRELFIIEPHPGSIVIIKDKDPNSNFYFNIISLNYYHEGDYGITFECCPWDEKTITPSTGKDYAMPDFENQLINWVVCISVYEKSKFLDDPLLQGYHDEFLEEFRILDEDANVKGFNYPQQIALSQYLESIIEKIENYKDGKNDPLIEELKEEAINLSNDLTKETKNGFLKRLVSIWAKARKGGLKISQFMLNEFGKEVMKEGAKAIIKFASENIHLIN